MRTIGYVRVSTVDQARSGLGIDDQRQRIEQEVARRGWPPTCMVVDDGYSARDLDRPGIAAALDTLAAGDADALVVAKLDRLSRSLVDFGSLMERAAGEGWALVALDLGVDTTTAAGELVANVMMAVAQWESRIIGERTTAALAVKRARGERVGRDRLMPDHVVDRIVDRREDGASLRAIAQELEDDGVPTATGRGSWHASTIHKALASVEYAAELAEAAA